MKERVRRRLAEWVEAEIARHFAPVLAAGDAAASGAVRGLVFAMRQGLGSAPRKSVARAVDALSPDERRRLGRLGISIGRLNVYFSDLLDARAMRWRALLFGLRQPGAQPAGLGAPSMPVDRAVPPAVYSACGDQVAGPRAVRVDRLERLAAAARQASRGGAFAISREMVSAAAAPLAEVGAILAAIGFPATSDGRHAAPPSRARAAAR
jgi:ATP-dependent RNA helicase SUPV3L1/SUV3